MNTKPLFNHFGCELFKTLNVEQNMVNCCLCKTLATHRALLFFIFLLVSHLFMQMESANIYETPAQGQLKMNQMTF